VKRACVGGNAGGTAVIVSHDADFLNEVCTHIIHFTPDAKLLYHAGNFESFKAKELRGDEAKAQQLLEVVERDVAGQDEGGAAQGDCTAKSLAPVDADRLVFPTPERIPGTSQSKTAPVVLTLKKASFKHEGTDAPVLREVNVELTTASRVAIVGKNGSGKSTLLSLLAGRLHPCSGDFWSHGSLRLVYVAQHHETQLGEYMNCTPVEYMQLRFKRGYDLEALPPHMEGQASTYRQTQRRKELARKHGKRGKEVESILSRQVAGKDGKEVIYEVKWKDLTPADNSFEKRTRLKTLGVEYMADEYDAWMAAAWGTQPERPLTARELTAHFEDFGLSEDVSCKRQITMLSSGQRSKLMLAASFWTKPHIICLDEPTNYLDSDTVDQLSRALRQFKGGYAIVSHSERFVEDVCGEVWTVDEGVVTATQKG